MSPEFHYFDSFCNLRNNLILRITLFLNCLPTAVPKSYAKRPICGTNPIAAKELRRLLDGSVRQRKGAIRCYYLTEFGTFYLPSEVRDLPASVQSIMRRDICDVGVQEGWLI